MRTISILFAAILFAGCGVSDVSVRSKIPSQSLSGYYYTAYTLYINGVKSMSSKESEFIIGSDDENNCISSMSFKTHLYNPLNLPTKYKVIPSPGDLYIVRGGSSIPVNGKPYDANFDGEFTAEILFYGEDEATMYADTKTVRKVPVSIKGWMKEKKYNYDPEGTANYDCDVTIEFTVEDVDYKIAITETYIVYYARDWFD